MQKTLGVTVREVDTLAEKTSTNETIPVEQPKLQPWEDDLFRTPTPKEMAMHLCKFKNEFFNTHICTYVFCAIIREKHKTKITKVEMNVIEVK